MLDNYFEESLVANIHGAGSSEHIFKKFLLDLEYIPDLDDEVFKYLFIRASRKDAFADYDTRGFDSSNIFVKIRNNIYIVVDNYFLNSLDQNENFILLVSIRNSSSIHRINVGTGENAIELLHPFEGEDQSKTDVIIKTLTPFCLGTQRDSKLFILDETIFSKTLSNNFTMHEINDNEILGKLSEFQLATNFPSTTYSTEFFIRHDSGLEDREVLIRSMLAYYYTPLSLKPILADEILTNLFIELTKIGISVNSRPADLDEILVHLANYMDENTRNILLSIFENSSLYPPEKIKVSSLPTNPTSAQILELYKNTTELAHYVLRNKENVISHEWAYINAMFNSYKHSLVNYY